MFEFKLKYIYNICSAKRMTFVICWLRLFDEKKKEKKLL